MAGHKKLTIFVDGASRGNPGKAAIGVVVQDAAGATLKNLSKTIGVTTNNVAEYLALIFAMQEALMLGAEEAEIFTDSELVAKQYSGEYRIKEPSLQQLSLLVGHLRGGFKKISLSHVPREQNKLADSQANKALDEAQFF